MPKPDEGAKTKFEEMREAIARGQKVIRVTGRVAGYRGKWPQVLNRPLATPPRILVTSFETTPTPKR